MYKIKTKKKIKPKLLKSKNRKHKSQKGGANGPRTSREINNINNIKNTFTNIKNTKIWIPTYDAKKNSNEHFKDWTDPYYGDKKVSVSGIGSVDWYLTEYILHMKKFFAEHNIKSVVDLGCGDFLMGPRLYAKQNIDYTGYDIVKSNIIDNNHKLEIQYLKSPKFKTISDPLREMKFEFIESDFTKEKDRQKIKTADLCIIKDVLQHLNDERITESVQALIDSKKYKYILICNNYIEDEFTSRNIPKHKEKDDKGCFTKYEYNEKGKLLQLTNKRNNIDSGHMARSLSVLREPLNTLRPPPVILKCFRSKEISLITNV